MAHFDLLFHVRFLAPCHLVKNCSVIREASYSSIYDGTVLYKMTRGYQFISNYMKLKPHP
jgi:hypothetical protein